MTGGELELVETLMVKVETGRIRDYSIQEHTETPVIRGFRGLTLIFRVQYVYKTCMEPDNKDSSTNVELYKGRKIPDIRDIKVLNYDTGPHAFYSRAHDVAVRERQPHELPMASLVYFIQMYIPSAKKARGFKMSITDVLKEMSSPLPKDFRDMFIGLLPPPDVSPSLHSSESAITTYYTPDTVVETPLSSAPTESPRDCQQDVPQPEKETRKRKRDDDNDGSENDRLGGTDERPCKRHNILSIGLLGYGISISLYSGH